MDQGVSLSSLYAAISVLTFFYGITLDRSELMAKMQPFHLPRNLPVVLCREVVSGLIAAAPSLKLQTELLMAYGARLLGRIHSWMNHLHRILVRWEKPLEPFCCHVALCLWNHHLLRICLLK